MDVTDVARLRDCRLELRDHLSALINAEIATLNGLDSCARSVTAFVAFLRDANLSVVHPLVRDVLSRIPSIMQQAANLPYELAECHSIIQKIIESNDQLEVVLANRDSDRGQIG